jgi:hypothetical protein
LNASNAISQKVKLHKVSRPMKNALFLIFFLLSFSIFAQTHRIGINGGITTISSYDGFPPFGSGSPFHAKGGYVASLSYSFVFKNNFTINLRNGLTVLHFLDDSRSLPVQLVGPDNHSNNYNYTANIGGGYLLQISNRYSIAFESGGSLFYRFRNVGYTEGMPETRRVYIGTWNPRDRHYGIYLAINHNYRIHRAQHYALYLTGSLHATNLFNYFNIKEFSSNENSSRILPELTFGVAVAFGKNGRKRF